MRIALLGAGQIGALHGRHLALDRRVDEVVVADVDPVRARDLVRTIGGRTAPDAESAIASADAVVIASSTDAHATLVRAGIARGIPVFCEKPLAFDLDETIELVEAIERTGALVQVGFQRRFDAAYAEARTLIERGDLGTVYLIKLIAHDHQPPPDAYIPVSGGLFRDSSIHDFDALRWVTGVEIEDIYTVGSVLVSPVFAKHDDVDTAVGIIRLVDGSLASLSQTRKDPRGYDIRMELVGSLDSVVIGLEARTPLRSLEAQAPPMASPWTTFLTRFETAYQAELIAFVGAVDGALVSPCSARDAMEAMRISIAAGRSRRERRAVRLDEIATAVAPS